MSVWPKLPEHLPDEYQCRHFKPRAERIGSDEPLELVAPNIPKVDLTEPTGDDFAEVGQPATLLPIKRKCMGVTPEGEACPEAAIEGEPFCADCYEKVNHVAHPGAASDDEPEPPAVAKPKDSKRSASLKTFEGKRFDGSPVAPQCKETSEATGKRCERKVKRGFPYCPQHGRMPKNRAEMELIAERFGLELPKGWHETGQSA